MEIPWKDLSDKLKFTLLSIAVLCNVWLTSIFLLNPVFFNNNIYPDILISVSLSMSWYMAWMLIMFQSSRTFMKSTLGKAKTEMYLYTAGVFSVLFLLLSMGVNYHYRVKFHFFVEYSFAFVACIVFILFFIGVCETRKPEKNDKVNNTTDKPY